MRNWGFKSSINQKDLDAVDMSEVKDGAINIEEEKEKYLGGDDDKFEGFVDSDIEVDYDQF